jgi:hypothetical protein
MITPFLWATPILDDAWGHSPPQIDQSKVFQLILQNPNGMKLRRGFQVPLQDLQTCCQFGAAAISLPETNSNWALSHQYSQFYHFLHSTWSNSAFQVSHRGTATIVCPRWATRVIEKGQDHLGLGRWSYIMLWDRKGQQVTIVTAYNCGYSVGLKMACQQQNRLLSKLFRDHHIPGTPNPHHQFILDIQSWVSHLIHLGHEIILALDANKTYNPDMTGSSSPLTYTPGVPHLQ